MGFDDDSLVGNKQVGGYSDQSRFASKISQALNVRVAAMITAKFDTRNVIDERFARDVRRVVVHEPDAIAAAIAETADRLGIRGFAEELFFRARLKLGTRFVVIDGDRQ